MRLRLAKKSDANTLAQIHLECGLIQPDGFMHRLGLNFLKTYYQILLEEKCSIVLLAEDENGFVHGFHSGTLAAEEHLLSLKKNKIKIFISLFPKILINPLIIKDLLLRNKYINSSTSSEKFGITFGPRGEYWALRPESKNAGVAISLLETWLNIVFELGCSSIKAEVDRSNNKVLEIHKILGAKIIQEMNLMDGRHRVVIEYTKISKW